MTPLDTERTEALKVPWTRYLRPSDYASKTAMACFSWVEVPCLELVGLAIPFPRRTVSPPRAYALVYHVPVLIRKVYTPSMEGWIPYSVASCKRWSIILHRAPV